MKRIVCGIKDGRSFVCANDNIDLTKLAQLPSAVSVDNMPSAAAFQLFFTNNPQQTLDTVPENASFAKPFQMPAPKGSFQFAVVQFPPTQPILDIARIKNSNISEDYRKFALHRTHDNDYCVILHGNLTAIIGEDDSNLVEHHLTAGDIIILGDATHSWFNHGPETCYLLTAKFSFDDHWG